jgi:hypothetical protein
VDRIAKGERLLLPKPELRIRLDPAVRRVLRVEHRGAAIKVFAGDDQPHQEGQVAHWIKADSLTYSDELVEELKE